MGSWYNETMKKPIQIYLDEEHIKELKKMAIDKGKTLTDLVKDRLVLTAKEYETRGQTAEKNSVPQAEEPCPHGYAKGFCKKADCNRRFK